MDEEGTCAYNKEGFTETSRGSWIWFPPYRVRMQLVQAIVNSGLVSMQEHPLML